MASMNYSLNGLIYGKVRWSSTCAWSVLRWDLMCLSNANIFSSAKLSILCAYRSVCASPPNFTVPSHCALVTDICEGKPDQIKYTTERCLQTSVRYLFRTKIQKVKYCAVGDGWISLRGYNRDGQATFRLNHSWANLPVRLLQEVCL